MIDKRPWWQKEFLATQTNKKIIYWLEEQNKIKEWKDKEKLIIQAYQKEIFEIRKQIKELEKLIKSKEEECNQCLVKILDGDTGLKELIVGKSSRK